MAKRIEESQVARSEFNPIKLVFIVVSVLAGLYFVTSVAALIFPNSGIPFVWAAFPVAPHGPPIP